MPMIDIYAAAGTFTDIKKLANGLEVSKRAFIDRDPTVVEQYFGASYKQHNMQDEASGVDTAGGHAPCSQT
jgi:hypothetical protein